MRGWKRLGKDPAVVLSKAGVTPEVAGDPATRLEVRTQIKLLDLAAEELQDDLLGFRLARNFDLREIGLTLLLLASSEQLADALRNAERYSRIMNEGVASGSICRMEGRRSRSITSTSTAMPIGTRSNSGWWRWSACADR